MPAGAERRPASVSSDRLTGRVGSIALIALLTVLAGGVGTLTAFGTSTIMVPVLVAFYSMPQALLLVGVVHWFGDIWKMLLFRGGARWRLVLLFGASGILATGIGGRLVFRAPEELLRRVLGAFLLAYVVFLFVKGRFRLPQTASMALAGGGLYGLFAGVFGAGGAVRGAFLAAYDLPKAGHSCSCRRWGAPLHRRGRSGGRSRP